MAFFGILIRVMEIANQEDPSQYSKLFVWKLKPIIPVLPFCGLPAVFQVGIFCGRTATARSLLIIVSPKIWEFLKNTGGSSSSGT